MMSPPLRSIVKSRVSVITEIEPGLAESVDTVAGAETTGVEEGAVGAGAAFGRSDGAVGRSAEMAERSALLTPVSTLGG